MALTTYKQQMTRKEAKQWIAERGIERLPTSSERLEYIPPFSYDQYDMERSETGFVLIANILN